MSDKSNLMRQIFFLERRSFVYKCIRNFFFITLIYRKLLSFFFARCRRYHQITWLLKNKIAKCLVFFSFPLVRFLSIFFLNKRIKERKKICKCQNQREWRKKDISMKRGREWMCSCMHAWMNEWEKIFNKWPNLRFVCTKKKMVS